MCMCSDFHDGVREFTHNAVELLADKEVPEDLFVRYGQGGPPIQEEAGVCTLADSVVGFPMELMSAVPQLPMQAVRLLKVNLENGEQVGGRGCLWLAGVRVYLAGPHDEHYRESTVPLTSVHVIHVCTLAYEARNHPIRRTVSLRLLSGMWDGLGDTDWGRKIWLNIIQQSYLTKHSNSHTLLPGQC
jgi:hypothetical protein